MMIEYGRVEAVTLLDASVTRGGINFRDEGALIGLDNEHATS